MFSAELGVLTIDLRLGILTPIVYVRFSFFWDVAREADLVAKYTNTWYSKFTPFVTSFTYLKYVPTHSLFQDDVAVHV